MADDRPVPFRAFIQGLLADPNVSRLSNEDFGMFHKLLYRSWLDRGVPDDVNQLADLVGMDGDLFAEFHWPHVRRCFAARLEEDGTTTRLVYAGSEVERRRLDASVDRAAQEKLGRQIRAQRAAKGRWEKAQRKLRLVALLVLPHLSSHVTAVLERFD